MFVESLILCKHLPHLTDLDITGLYDSEYSWTIHSPESLISLRLSNWDGSVALPSSLLHFEVEVVTLSSFASTLPASLESYVVRDQWDGVDLMVPLLPPSTRKLHLGTYPDLLNEMGSWYTLLEQLPKFLTCFAVPDSDDIDFESNPEWISLLPETLTELDIGPGFPCSAWHLLPPSLTKLSLDVPEYIVPTLSTVDDAGVECELSPIPFDLLPSSLTRLQVRSYDPFRLCRLPTTYHQSYFPPNLTWLQLPELLHLSPPLVKLLPSSLTYLEIPNLCEQVCEFLPTGLKTLKSSQTLMSPKLLQLLPTSLTSLQLNLCRRLSYWFNYNTGEAASITKFPEYLIHQKCLSITFDWKPLPSTLIHLEITGPNNLGDLFLQHQLFNLLELRLRDSKGFHDLSIPLLSQHLTTLDLGSSSMISGKSFEFLPRCLIELNLDSSEFIFDSHIQHLPRTLKHLHLQNAIHLTELCIVHLPPNLQKLNMLSNSQITPSSFPSFPYCLRSGDASFEQWGTSRGKIHQKR